MRLNEIGKSRASWVLLAIGLLGAVTSFTLLANIFVLQQAESDIGVEETAPTGTQAILILGAYVRPNGSLSPVLRERLDTGLGLYRRGGAPKILLTGDHGTKTYNEVQAMKDYLTSQGVPEQDIFMDHAGFDTYDSLYRARDVFGLRHLLIVSQDFHVPRAVYIARTLGLDAYGVVTPDVYPWWFRMVMREWLARDKAVLDVELLHPKPKFLGPTIDIRGDGRVTQD